MRRTLLLKAMHLMNKRKNCKLISIIRWWTQEVFQQSLMRTSSRQEKNWSILISNCSSVVSINTITLRRRLKVCLLRKFRVLPPVLITIFSWLMAVVLCQVRMLSNFSNHSMLKLKPPGISSCVTWKTFAKMLLKNLVLVIKSAWLSSLVKAKQKRSEEKCLLTKLKTSSHGKIWMVKHT